MTNITITTTKAKFPGNLADEYLALKAQIADLKKKEDDIKARLIGLGQTVIEGNFGRVTVSLRQGAMTVDYKAAATENLLPSVLGQYTKAGKSSYVFAVKARQGNEEIAA